MEVLMNDVIINPDIFDDVDLPDLVSLPSLSSTSKSTAQHQHHQLYGSNVIDQLQPQIEFLRPLGSGGFGEVWKVNICAVHKACYDIDDREVLVQSPQINFSVALKVVKTKELGHEYHIWRKLTDLAAQSVPIVKMYNILGVTIQRNIFNDNDVDSPRVGMSMELCGGGSLAHRLQYNSRDCLPRQLLTEHQAAAVVRRVAEGLHFCHVNGVIHLDIKPDNVLFYDDTSDSATLADFGLAMDLADGSCVTEQMPNGTRLRYTARRVAGVGTPGYIAPEVEEHGIYSAAADAWGLGALLLEALTGVLPRYRWPENGELRHWLVDYMSNQRPTNTRWLNLSGMVVDVLFGLLSPDPSHRLTMAQLLQHPWLSLYQYDIQDH